MESRKERIARVRPHVQKRLRVRLALYALIALVLTGIVVLHVVRDGVGPLLPLAGLALGAAVGVGASRMYRITWDEGARQVVSRLDKIGVAILVLYVLFEVFREKILPEILPGRAAVAVSFAILVGIMVGRIAGIRSRVVGELKKREIIT
jgi:hypothetical protein